MKQKLTSKFVESLKAKAARYDVWDTETRGFGIRVQQGSKTYVVRYLSETGERRRFDIGSVDNIALAAARDKASQIKIDKKSGVDVAKAKKDDKAATTFNALLDHYIEHHAKVEKKTWKQDASRIKTYLRPRWGAKKPWEVKRDDVQELVDEISRKAPVQARRVRALVSRVFNYAITRREFNRHLEFNPCLSLAKLKKEKPRDRVLSATELQLLWRASEAEEIKLRAFIRLRMITLQRGEDIVSMKVQHVQGDWWTMPDSKTGRPHRVWMSREAKREVEQLVDLALQRRLRDAKDPRVDYLFPSREKNAAVSYWKSFTKAVHDFGVKADVTGFQSKDLRRTGATNMLEKRICDRTTMARILNHVETGVLGQHYDKYAYDQEKRDALEKWATLLKGLVE